MKVSRDQQGIAHLAGLALFVVVIAVIAYAGYGVVKNDAADTTPATSDSRSTTVPKEIKSKNDVRKAENALDNTSIESDVNPDQLSGDINALQ